MTTLLKPSTLIAKGVRVQQINHLTLFKLTDQLGARLQTLLEKKKSDSLTADETLELEAIRFAAYGRRTRRDLQLHQRSDDS